LLINSTIIVQEKAIYKAEDTKERRKANRNNRRES